MESYSFTPIDRSSVPPRGAGKPGKNMMTLRRFFDSREDAAYIECETEQHAKKLAAAFYKLRREMGLPITITKRGNRVYMISERETMLINITEAEVSS